MARAKVSLPKSVRKHADVLCILAKANPKVVRSVIAGANPELLKVLSQCSLNVLKGVVPITPAQKKKLHKYKTALRVLANHKSSQRQKKALLQKGGFAGALLGALVPLLAQGVGAALKRGPRRRR